MPTTIMHFTSKYLHVLSCSRSSKVADFWTVFLTYYCYHYLIQTLSDVTSGLLCGDFIFEFDTTLYAAKFVVSFLQGTVHTYKTRCGWLCLSSSDQQQPKSYLAQFQILQFFCWKQPCHIYSTGKLGDVLMCLDCPSWAVKSEEYATY